MKVNESTVVKREYVLTEDELVDIFATLYPSVPLSRSQWAIYDTLKKLGVMEYGARVG